MGKMIVGIILFTVLIIASIAIGTWLFYVPPPKENSLEQIFESIFWKRLEEEEKKHEKE